MSFSSGAFRCACDRCAFLLLTQSAVAGGLLHELLDDAAGNGLALVVLGIVDELPADADRAVLVVGHFGGAELRGRALAVGVVARVAEGEVLGLVGRPIARVARDVVLRLESLHVVGRDVLRGPGGRLGERPFSEPVHEASLRLHAFVGGRGRGTASTRRLSPSSIQRSASSRASARITSRAARWATRSPTRSASRSRAPGAPPSAELSRNPIRRKPTTLASS